MAEVKDKKIPGSLLVVKLFVLLFPSGQCLKKNMNASRPSEHLLAHSNFDYKFDPESDSDSDAYFVIAPSETPISLRSSL